MGGGEIALLLVVMVVDVHRRHIQPWVGEVVEVVVGVLRIRQQGVLPEGLAQCALRHHVGIPLTVLVLELPRLFAHEGSGVATLRAIEISLGRATRLRRVVRRAPSQGVGSGHRHCGERTSCRSHPSSCR